MAEERERVYWRFLDEGEREFVREPERSVPVAYDADVVVAGGGSSGLFAAIAAGRLGAKTVVVDRFGSLGGNIGPGFIVGASLSTTRYNADTTLPGGLPGIPKEFVSRVHGFLRDPEIDYNFMEIANIASYVGMKMIREAGVEPVLSAYASDPIIENDHIRGLFVEGKSGRVAIRARVVIDATGDADIAARAGVPVMNCIPSDPSYASLIAHSLKQDSWPWNTADYSLYNEGEIMFALGGVEFDRYQQFIYADDPTGTGFGVPLSEDDKAWATENLWGLNVQAFPYALVPAMRKEWEAGGFRTIRIIEPGLWIMSCGKMLFHDGSGVVCSRAAGVAGRFHSGDMAQVSKVEAALRVQAFETLQFLRAHAPGFENAYIIFMSPFLGTRGGPCIEGEHVLTPEEGFSGRKFDDTLFRNTTAAEPKWGGEPSGFDTPYSILLPKGIDGLLVTGTGASYMRRGHDPSAFRRRTALMVLGQATGTAAALAVRQGATPKTLDIKILQQQLIDDGIYLGDEDRLKELGLCSSCRA